MGFGSDITAQLGLNVRPFMQGLQNSERAVEGLNKKFTKLGLGFGGLGLAVGTMKALVDHARNLEGALDANSAAAKRFASDIDSAKASMLDLGVKGMGALNRVGEWMGEGWSRALRGDEQTDDAARAERGAATTSANLEKFKKTNDPAKLTSAREDQKKTAREMEMDRSDNAGKINILLKEQVELNKIVNSATATTLQREEAKAQLAEKNLEIYRINKKLREDEVEKASKLSQVEGKISEAKRNAQFEQLDSAKQIKMVAEEELAIKNALKSVQGDIVASKNMELQLAEKQLEKTKLIQAQREKAAKAQSNITSLTAELDTAKKERSGMTLEELASKTSFGVGVSAEIGEQGARARDAMSLQRRGEEARKSGDAEGATKFFEQADAIKGSLTALKPSESADPFEKIKQEMKQQVEELKTANGYLGGLFKMQK
jgi:hypothetical protein